jgi:predicted methyltransferase MtxX (methanogen marker protein 4)
MADDKQRISVSGSAQHRRSVAEEPVTSVLSANEVPVFDRELTADEEVLAALGYKYARHHRTPHAPLTATQA